MKNLKIGLGGHQFVFLQHPVARLNKKLQVIKTSNKRLFFPRKADGSNHNFISVCTHKNISNTRVFNFSQGSVLMHDTCSLASHGNHIFMKRQLKHQVLASSDYLPLLSVSEELLQEFVLNNSHNLFQQSNDFISPERLTRLQKLSRTAQNNEINMQKYIAAAQSLSWFDQCIKFLAQFCLGLPCGLVLCMALVVGVRICGYCFEEKN